MIMKPGAKIFIKNKKLNKYLFFLRDNKFDIVNPNMWSTLGGGIEINESPEEALKREIKEESNIKIYNIQLIGEQKSTNIIRDKNKKITAVFRQPNITAQEMISSSDPELMVFLGQDENQSKSMVKYLQQSDLNMIRVIEDLINILIKKNIIRFTDFPEASQSKIVNRQKIREQLRNLM